MQLSFLHRLCVSVRGCRKLENQYCRKILKDSTISINLGGPDGEVVVSPHTLLLHEGGQAVLQRFDARETVAASSHTCRFQSITAGAHNSAVKRTENRVELRQQVRIHATHSVLLAEKSEVEVCHFHSCAGCH